MGPARIAAPHLALREAVVAQQQVVRREALQRFPGSCRHGLDEARVVGELAQGDERRDVPACARFPEGSFQGRARGRAGVLREQRQDHDPVHVRGQQAAQGVTQPWPAVAHPELHHVVVPSRFPRARAWAREWISRGDPSLVQIER